MAWDTTKVANDDILSADWNSMVTDQKSRAPIGSVVAWLKSYTNTPALPAGWVECSGQTLSDANSVYNGQVIPQLNAIDATVTSLGFSGAGDFFEGTNYTTAQVAIGTAYLGKTFSSAYVSSVTLSFSSDTWSNVTMKLQYYNGSTWSDISTFTSNQTNVIVTMNLTVQGLRLLYTGSSAGFKNGVITKFVGPFTHSFLRGNSVSGATGGGQGVTVSAANSIAATAPYYEVVWIMRVK